jgi:hypothetical protein
MSAAPPSRSGLPRLVIDLCRLRGEPQHFPYAPNLIVLLLGANVALDALVGNALNDTGDMLARSLLSTGVVLALCWVALAVRGLRNRYLQTAGALLACSLAFSLLQLPLGLLFDPAIHGSAGTITPPAQVLLQFLISWAAIGLTFWQIAVNAHIMRHAIDAGFGLALLLVVSWVLACWALDRLVFGAG